MKVCKPDNLALLAHPCRIEGGRYLSVGALACFSLAAAEPPPPLPEGELWKLAASYLQRSDFLDEGWPKRQGEFIVHGAAWNASMATATAVRVAVGTQTKTLVVTGDRHWRDDGVPGTPAAFRTMPVNFTRAFGGPGYPFNPVGRGFAAGAEGVRMLPNVQYPAKPMTSPRETPLPASFTPYGAAWPQRRSLLGRFDDTWRVERWPYLPVGASPDYFNIAPEDQRLRGFFRGDEAVEIANMHPERPRIAARLPGLRARIFAVRKTGAAEQFLEVKTRAETLWLYPGELRGIVLYRGLLPVEDEELDDLPYLLAAWENLTEEARPPEYYQGRLQESLAPLAIPEGETATDASPEALAAAYLTPGGDKIPPAPVELIAGAQELLDKTREKLTAANLEGRSCGAFLPAEMAGELPAAGAVEQLLSCWEAAAGAAPGGVTTTPAGAGEGTREDALGRPRRPGAMSAEEVIARHRQGLPLQGIDAAGGDFSGAELAGADFAEAVLSGASFAGAHLRGASFRQAILNGTDFRRADLTGANLTEATGPEASFAEARLEKAELAEGDWTGADLTKSDLTGADLSGARFSNAVLRGCRARSSRAVRTDFTDADLTEADFRDSDLAGADCSGALLDRCVLAGVRGGEMRLFSVRGAGTDFRRACLPGLRGGAGATLKEVCLRGADLTGASLGGMEFVAADLEDAVMDHSDFSRAVFTEVKMVNATARETSFMKARFDRCDLRGVNLFGGSLRKARLTDVDLRDASLFGVDLFEAKLRDVIRQRTNLQRTLLALKGAAGR